MRIFNKIFVLVLVIFAFMWMVGKAEVAGLPTFKDVVGKEKQNKEKQKNS